MIGLIGAPPDCPYTPFARTAKDKAVPYRSAFPKEPGTGPTMLPTCWNRVPSPVGAGNCVTLCGLGILVDQATEPVPTQNPDVRA
jgi:hypothetical protein